MYTEDGTSGVTNSVVFYQLGYHKVTLNGSGLEIGDSTTCTYDDGYLAGYFCSNASLDGYSNNSEDYRRLHKIGICTECGNNYYLPGTEMYFEIGSGSTDTISVKRTDTNTLYKECTGSELSDCHTGMPDAPIEVSPWEI